MVGKPVIRGTRIPVELIVRMLAQGIPENDILAEYPRLELEDIRAALTYAAQVLAHEDVFPQSQDGLFPIDHFHLPDSCQDH